ncbi:MAG: ankyrin repeat domain-containing protein [Gammaproteobacteria bacterium]
MNSAWKKAIEQGDVDAVRQQLNLGADINVRDRYGQTGLMLAARAGQQEVVHTLIANGADLNVTAKYGLSALMLAVIAGHTDIARMLARAGADLSIRGRGTPGFAGKTAYDLALGQKMHELYEELDPRR